MIGTYILCFLLGVIATLLFALTFSCIDMHDYEQYMDDMKNHEIKETEED